MSDRRAEADRIEAPKVRKAGASPPPHAHPRDEAPVIAHEARGAVSDEEREPECDG